MSGFNVNLVGQEPWELRGANEARIRSLETIAQGTSWTTYTPQLTASTTNPTLGSGSVAQGRWQRAGRIIACQFYIKFGSSGTAQGVGLYRVSLPVTSAPAASAPTRTSSFPAGVGWGFNGAANLQYAGVELAAAGPGGIVDRVEFRVFSSPLTVFTDAVPFVWGANMEITGSLTYEAAS
jgi:hypothetical protein